MIEIRNKLDQLKNLSDPKTFIEEKQYHYDASEDFYSDTIKENDYFLSIWKDEYNDYIGELLLYCGTYLIYFIHYSKVKKWNILYTNISQNHQKL